MIYSCFNHRLGMYEYFSDSKGHPTNGDLPVPRPSRPAGKIGSPSIDSGRPLPPSAKAVGRGYRARGLLVACSGTRVPALSGMGGADSAPRRVTWLLAGAVVALAGVLIVQGREG